MTKLSEAGRAFLRLPIQYHRVGATRMAYRVTGEGPPILLIHGWPLTSFTWRKLLPTLAKHHRCYVVDLLGAGDTRLAETETVTFRDQVNALASLTRALDLRDYAIVAHDSGATIARHLALVDTDRVCALAMMNTEIPYHRPPALAVAPRLVAMPGSYALFRSLLGSKRLLRSKYGFGSCFVDRGCIDDEFLAHFVDPLKNDPVRLHGQLAYVRGIDWGMLDELREGHARIHQPVLFLWGDRDPWFPLADARVMETQLKNCLGFETFPGSLFIHEEQPTAIAERIISFLAERAVVRDVQHDVS